MWRRSGSGRACIDVPIRKWAGVRAARSFGSSLSGRSGREFMWDSICVSTVHMSSNDNLDGPSCRNRCFLATFTADSHNPPKWGAFGGVRCQVIPSAVQNSWIFSCSASWLSIVYSRASSFLAPSKFLPLSE
uniref:(northern house mosquito) hypothetical protein n=1 Tax=Culex pipiens TaxID=7175 RepID=A0A8D8FLH0_CULPI